MKTKKDYEHYLLRGRPISMECGITVYPFTVDEILFTIGESKYYRYLNLITMSTNQIDTYFKDTFGENSDLETTFEFLTYYSSLSSDFARMVCESISTFILEEVKFIDSLSVFVIGDSDGKMNSTEGIKIIDSAIFEELTSIIAYQNCVNKDGKEVEKFSEHAEEIKRQIQERREIIAKLKKNKSGGKDNENSPLTLTDLCSVMASNCNGLNIFNVFDLTMYSLNDQFARMKMLEEYDIGIQQILAGVDPKKIDLKHWMSQI